MSIVVERGIPMPHRRAAGRPVKYPFNDMDVGDSFMITGSMSTINVREAIRYHVRKNPGRKFIVRKSSDPFSKITRCWRVK